MRGMRPKRRGTITLPLREGRKHEVFSGRGQESLKKSDPSFCSCPIAEPLPEKSVSLRSRIFRPSRKGRVILGVSSPRPRPAAFAAGERARRGSRGLGDSLGFLSPWIPAFAGMTVVFVLIMLFSTPSFAQTTATFGEKAIGEGCGNLSAGADFDTLFQCNTSAASGGLQQKAPLFVGAVTAPPYAATTCDSSKAGMIQYIGGAFQGCNGSAWSSLGGTICSDATPTAFSFADQANIAVSTLVTSDIVQVTGFTCTINVGIAGAGSPAYRMCSDAACATVIQDWTTAASTIASSNYVQARVTSSASGGVTTNVTLTAGNTATVWDVSTVGDCASSPSIGTVCADGSVYAGLTPDGNVPFYATRCDAGQTWDGTTCSGVAFTLTWNNGTANWITAGVTNSATGRANTTTLAALADAASPHVAAQHCENLIEDGASDWYLPARTELAVMYNNSPAIGNFNTSGVYYWSSTETSSNAAYGQRFSDGYQNYYRKDYSLLVRCVRR